MQARKFIHFFYLSFLIFAVSCASSQDNLKVQKSGTQGEPLDVSKYTKANAMDHVVLVVFENRSFDNLLGQLYAPGEVANFDGVTGKNLTNPIPKWAKHGANKRYVAYHTTTNMNAPDPDSGEWYAHTNTQLYNILDKNNRFKTDNKIKFPWNAPRSATQAANMNGFVTDYISTYTAEIGRQPTYDEYAQIMSGFSPQQVPVISGIARGFTTFDHWYSEVPSQTFANRSFWTSATSSGLVKNSLDFIKHNDGETIFERLDSHGKTWKIYVSDGALVSLQALIHSSRLRAKFATNVVPFKQFEQDAKNGRLPDFAFIEPNIGFKHNDYHPSIAHAMVKEKSAANAIKNYEISPVIGGEQFLARIYNAIKNSNSNNGSNYLNTTLFVGFDEPGGTYDHVAPPVVASPMCGHPAGQFGFTFERSGYRVPAIIVSAWVPEKTVVNEEYRHTSMIATLRKVWNLGAPFTNRDAHANTFDKVFTLDQPRLADTWPEVNPRSLQHHKEMTFQQLDRNLSGLGYHMNDAVVALAKAEQVILPCMRTSVKKSDVSTVACISEFSADLFPLLYQAHVHHMKSAKHDQPKKSLHTMKHSKKHNHNHEHAVCHHHHKHTHSKKK